MFALSKGDHGQTDEADLAILNAKTVSDDVWDFVVSQLLEAFGHNPGRFRGSGFETYTVPPES